MTNSQRWAGGASALALLMQGLPARAAEIQGSVMIEGPAPAPETFVIRAKSKQHSIEGCGPVEKASSKLRIGHRGGVKDAVVWVEEAEQERGAVPSLLMDQKGCVFLPHVLAVPAGGSVAIRNSDRVIHNVRIFREGKAVMLMHQWQKADAADILWRFEEPGRYLVRCGVHPWMYGWVFVAPGSAVAVTDEGGGFVLAGVRPGKHTLRVWHETLGSREILVEVGPEGERIDPVRFSLPEGSS